MARCGTRRPLAIAIVCAVTVGSIGMASGRAEAFGLKRDAHGQSLHWPGSQVTYVVDPSIDQAVPGGSQAVSGAVSVWNGTAGVPSLTTVRGVPGTKPGLDGKNSILLAPGGFAPAGNALAVTITSYDEATGHIVDADIVINGIHEFAVLPSGARAANDAPRVSTDGTSSAAVDGPRTKPFDVSHVVSHEIGHTLGLADEQIDDSALMYAFTMPGDASVRAPSADDAGGMQALYGMSARVPVPTSGQGGCGQASVAGSRAHPEDTWYALALLSGATLWLASRRQAKVAGRLALPVAAALMTLLASPATAHSAEDAFDPTASVTARVLGVSTSNVGGLFETTVELAPTRCADQFCPTLPRVHTWGGTLGGITQIVGGGLVPNVGDLVAVTFLKALSPDRRLDRPVVTALVALGTAGGVALFVERH